MSSSGMSCCALGIGEMLWRQREQRQNKEETSNNINSLNRMVVQTGIQKLAACMLNSDH